MLSPRHDVKEQAVLLGPRRSMVGVISPAAPSATTADRPTAVILNTGIVHRVGANRMSVLLARALAAAGTTAVRFDLSGIGDSEPRADSLDPLEASQADVTETLDSLESSGRGRRFVLIGLCSGADLSLIGSAADARVVGAVLLNPSIPRTYHFWLHYIRQRALQLDFWRGLMRGQNLLWKRLKQKATGARSPAPPDEPFPRQARIQSPEVRAYLEGTYQRSLAKGVQFLVALTRDDWPYREPLFHAFPKVPFGTQLRVEYFPRADHVFTGVNDRERVIGLIVRWINETHFASRAGDDGIREAECERERC